MFSVMYSPTQNFTLNNFCSKHFSPKTLFDLEKCIFQSIFTKNLVFYQKMKRKALEISENTQHFQNLELERIVCYETQAKTSIFDRRRIAVELKHSNPDILGILWLNNGS